MNKNQPQMDIVKEAEELAYAAHNLQERRGGEPYIEHPKRIVERLEKTFRGEISDERLDLILATAWLHDSIEDSWVTKEFLEDNGFDWLVIDAVVRLTHNKKLHEAYVDYIRRVAQDRIATIVKTFDIVDNLSDNPSDRQIEKYGLALSILNNHL